MLSALGTILIAAAVLGLLALAAKYGLGPVPADYHARIFARDGTSPSPGVLTVLGALYRAVAGMLVAVALGLAVLAMQLRAGGGVAVLLGMVGMVLAAGGVTALVTWQVERRTGVRTPWRLAMALVIIALLGAVTIG